MIQAYIHARLIESLLTEGHTERASLVTRGIPDGCVLRGVKMVDDAVELTFDSPRNEPDQLVDILVEQGGPHASH
jgi:hypothetical protein